MFQEILLNLVCCALYLAASSLLMTEVFTELYYLYHTVIGFTAYPALTGVYVMGFAAGVVHFIDAILAFVFWRQQPSLHAQSRQARRIKSKHEILQCVRLCKSRVSTGDNKISAF